MKDELLRVVNLFFKNPQKYFLRVNLWTGLLGVYIRSCSNGEKFIIGKSCVDDFCRSFYGSWLWGDVQAAKTVVENLVIKESREVPKIKALKEQQKRGQKNSTR